MYRSNSANRDCMRAKTAKIHFLERRLGTSESGNRCLYREVDGDSKLEGQRGISLRTVELSGHDVRSRNIADLSLPKLESRSMSSLEWFEFFYFGGRLPLGDSGSISRCAFDSEDQSIARFCRTSYWDNRGSRLHGNAASRCFSRIDSGYR
jgi:hypothetical protein